MKYYCPVCKRDHEGWPAIEFGFPEEYLSLTDQERELTCFIIGKDLKIEHQDHTHYYTQIYWPQKVQDSEDIWEFKVWVMVESHEAIKALQKGNVKMITASLQSNFPWYGEYFQGFPLGLSYNHKEKMPCIHDMVHRNSTIYKDYINGLPNNIAQNWCKDITQNGKWECIG